jgi:hypothetical protein
VSKTHKKRSITIKELRDALLTIGWMTGEQRADVERVVREVIDAKNAAKGGTP